MASQFIGSVQTDLPPEQLHDNQTGTVRRVAIAFIVLNSIVITLRWVSLKLTKVRRGWEEFLVLIAFLTSTAMPSLVLWQLDYTGLARHILTLNDKEIMLFGKATMAFGYLYIFSISAPKLVIGFLLMRIFVCRWERAACSIMIVLIATYTIICLIVHSLLCVPMKAIWDLGVMDAKCVDIAAWWTWSTIPSLVFNFLLIALPIPMILRINLPAIDKAGIILTFTAGGAGLMSTVARTVIFAQAKDLSDFSWFSVWPSIVSMIEASTHLLAVSIPTFRPLYLYMRKKGQFSVRHLSSHAERRNPPHPSTMTGGGQQRRWPGSSVIYHIHESDAEKLVGQQPHRDESSVQLVEVSPRVNKRDIDKDIRVETEFSVSIE